MASKRSIDELIEIMARLRDPDEGCPWDIEQDFGSIAPYTIEEAYEVAEAIARADWVELCDELGDLLLQVVYHAQMASEAGHFVFADVVESVCDKLVRRHPHVFGEAAIDTAAQQTRAWEEMKAAERGARANERGRQVGILDDVPVSLPALMRARKLQSRAARAGFLPESPEALERVEAALAPFRREPATPLHEREAALGRLIFEVANLARRLDVDPEEALRRANRELEAQVRRAEEADAQA